MPQETDESVLELRASRTMGHFVAGCGVEGKARDG